MNVIMHPEMGIYLGNFLGLGFWSKLDPVGQESAVVFDSEQQAREHLAGWRPVVNPEDYSFPPVVSQNPRYVHKKELREQGFEDWSSE